MAPKLGRSEMANFVCRRADCRRQRWSSPSRWAANSSAQAWWDPDRTNRDTRGKRLNRNDSLRVWCHIYDVEDHLAVGGRDRRVWDAAATAIRKPDAPPDVRGSGPRLDPVHGPDSLGPRCGRTSGPRWSSKHVRTSTRAGTAESWEMA